MFKKTVIGFDIGVSSVKLAVFSKFLGRITCEDLRVESFDPGKYSTIESAVRESSIFEDIAKVLETVDLKNKKIVVPLPGDVARAFILRDIDVSGNVVEEVGNRLTEILGVPLYGLSVDYVPVAKRGDKIDVIGILYITDIVEKFMSFFEAFTKDVELEPAVLTLYNGFVIAKGKGLSAKKLIIHLGVRDVVVVVLSESNEFIFGRTVVGTGSGITDEITLENVGSYLVTVSKAFKDALSTTGVEDLDGIEVYVSGGPSLSEILLNALRTVLKLRIEVLNVASGANFQVSTKAREAINSIAPRFNLAVSAALSRLI